MKLRKAMALFMVFCLCLGGYMPVRAEAVNGASDIVKEAGLDIPLKLQMEKVISSAKEGKAEVKADGRKSIRIVVQNDGSNIMSKLTKSGARVVERIATDLYAVTIPANKAMNILDIAGIKNVALDKLYELDPREMEGFDEVMKLETDQPNVGTTLDDTRVDEFNGSNGEGVTVAIIDTGVEPDHEFLRDTINGGIKIIDWQDFTTEGNLTASTVVQAVYEAVYSSVEIKGVKFTLPTEFAGKSVYYGEFYEGIFANEILFGYTESGSTGKDMNFDGDKKDYYPVFAADLDGDTIYDHAIVDTHLDKDLSDEQLLGIYKSTVDKTKAHSEQTNLIAHFPDKPGGRVGQHVNFVLTKLALNKDDEGNPDSLTINLGFDGGSHGTHVAGIATGMNADQNGDVVDRGVAPGANVIALKVLGSNVGGAMSHIINAMIYAAQNGADIVNMSLGSTGDINDGSNLEALYADMLSETYGTVFAISAGNNGTGINSIGSPGDSTWAISSGAYIDTETWSEYGANNPDTYGLWYFSSIGPREDGAIKPTILSPGSAVSSVPAWEEIADPKNPGLPDDTDLDRPDFPYHLYQGTSMSSPHTAGILALLLEKARKDGIASEYELPGSIAVERLNPVLARKAVRYTGNTDNLEDYKFAEIGGGLIDVVGAYEYIEDHHEDKFDRDIAAMTSNEKLPYGTGIFYRNSDVPESVEVKVLNYDSQETTLDLSKYSNGSWFDCDTDEVTIPEATVSGKEIIPGVAEITVSIDQDLEPGLYSDSIMCDDGDGVIDLEIPVTLAVSDKYASEDVGNKTYEGELASSKYDRHFVQIPNGTLEFTVTLNVGTDAAGVPLGKMRVLGFNPDGMEVPDFFEMVGDHAGLDSIFSGKTISYTVKNPIAGNWEFDVYSRWDQAKLQLKNGMDIQDAPYKVDIAIKCVVPDPDKWEAAAMPGTVLNQQFTFTNAMGQYIYPEVLGTALVDLDQEPVTQQLEFTSADTEYIDVVTIEKTDPNYIFEVSIMDTHDFDLFLYDGNFKTVAQCADGDGDESISLKALAAGTYYIVIDNYEGADTTLTYNKRILNSSDGLENSEIVITSPEGVVQKGASWVSDAQLTVPGIWGHDFMALILVKDKEEGTTIGNIPVYITSGQQTSGDLKIESFSVTPDSRISYDRPAILNAFSNKAGNWKVEVQDSFGTVVKTFTAENTTLFNASWAPGQFDGSGSYKACFTLTSGANTVSQTSTFEVYNFPIEITASKTLGEDNSEKTVFSKGEQIRARVKVVNLGPDTRDATLIIQVLDPSAEVIRLEYLEIEDMKADESGAMGISFKLDSKAKAGNYKIKTFLWDAYETMNPQSGVNETGFTVEK